MHAAYMLKPLFKEAIRSGTIASIAMMPVGFLFRHFGLRVGHYGNKLGAVLFANAGEPLLQGLLIAQHFVIGWLSALPMLMFMVFAQVCRPSYLLLTGILYGALYYLLINALALPLMFGDTLPLQMDFNVVYPSLIVHIVFGLSIGYTAQKFARKQCADRT
jgi:uncharacterized membrane protein YagU involved in acid resistance